MESFSSAQLEEVAAYHAPKYLLAAMDFVIWPALAALMVLFGTKPLAHWSQHTAATWSTWCSSTTPRFAALMTRVWHDDSWLWSLLFSIAFFSITTIAGLPELIYLDFFHEHQFAMSNESWSRFTFDVLKATVLAALSFGAVALGVFGLARRTKWWWLIIGSVAGVALLFSSMIDPYRSQVYFQQHSLPAGTLRDRITALMKQSGTAFSDVLVDETLVSTRRVQAYFAGQGSTRSIVLNDAMLTEFTEDEILAAVAHELGHVSEDKWPGRIAVSIALLAFLGFIEWLFRRGAHAHWFGITERADIRVLPLALLLFDFSAMAIAPVSGWSSRQRELAADHFAAELLRSPDRVEAMLVKAAKVNKMDPMPPRWLVWRGMSHPPIADRIEQLRAMKSPVR